MIKDQLSQKAQQYSVAALLALIEHASDKDMNRIFSMAEKLTRDNAAAQAQIPAIRKAWQEGAPAARLLQRALHELNPKVRSTLVNTIVLNNSYGEATKIKARLIKEENFRPPFACLISPTMRCNLNCVGCYAGEYQLSDDLPYEIIDRVIREGKEMGLYFYTILGGEPFVRKDMLQIYEKHNDCAFAVFTNGYLLNDETVHRIAELGNVYPMVSIEGFESDTDARRGPGTFRRIMDAFDLLHQAGAFYGFSSMVTRHNVETLCSDEFNDMLLEKGCFIGWHFLYMPVGRDPDPSLMPTAEQREFMRTHGAARIRATRPLFTFDFWNDAPYVGGCIAGGKEYLHINSHGDVEPCIFTHFAVDNIKGKSLRQVLESPFFQGIKARQPFNENLLLPCQLIDNPQAFRQLYAQFQPYPTHGGADSMVKELVPVLDAYAASVQQMMAPGWQHDFVERGFGRAKAAAPTAEKEKECA